MTMLASLTLLPAMLGFVGTNIDKLGPAAPPARRACRPPVGLVPLEPGHPAPALAGARWSGAALLLVLAMPAARACAWASATPATGRPIRHDPAGLRPDRPRASARAPTGRCCWWPRRPGGQIRPRHAGRACPASSTETPGVASRRTADPQRGRRRRHHAGRPRRPRRRTRTPQTLVHTPARRRRSPPRSGDRPPTVRVGGATAAVVDFSEYTADRLPWFIGAVLVLSFLLLMVVFRSLLVPLKAVIMNLLSVGAAYGVLVAVFQWGWGTGLLGVGKEGPIEAWVPMMLFAVIFGLSMDYEVFLLSRIREEYDRTPRQRHRGGQRPGRHRPGHHRGRRDHVLRVRGVRARRRPVAQDVRARPGHGGAARRHRRPAGAGAGHDGAARRPQLVAAAAGSTACCPVVHVEPVEDDVPAVSARPATGGSPPASADPSPSTWADAACRVRPPAWRTPLGVWASATAAPTVVGANGRPAGIPRHSPAGPVAGAAVSVGRRRVREPRAQVSSPGRHERSRLRAGRGACRRGGAGGRRRDGRVGRRGRDGHRGARRSARRGGRGRCCGCATASVSRRP